MSGNAKTKSTTSWPGFLGYPGAFDQPGGGLLNQFGNEIQGWMQNSPMTLPEGMNQQLAGFTPYQQAGLAGLGGAAGQQGQDVGAMRQSMLDTVGGQYLDPSTNPWLEQTYRQGAKSLTDEYQQATVPGLMADAQRAGAFGGASDVQRQGFAQQGLGLGLSDLATNIYGGNYGRERQNQLQATSQIPSLMQSETSPWGTLMAAGGQQQQQQQAGLDIGTQNAARQYGFPQERLNSIGSFLGQLAGKAGDTRSNTHK